MRARYFLSGAFSLSFFAGKIVEQLENEVDFYLRTHCGLAAILYNPLLLRKPLPFRNIRLFGIYYKYYLYLDNFFFYIDISVKNE